MSRTDHHTTPQGAVLVLVLITLLLFSTVVLQVVQHAVQTEEDHVLLLQMVHAGFQAEAGLNKALELLAAVDVSNTADGPLGLPAWQEDAIRITIIPTNAKLNLNALHPPLLHPQAMDRMRRGLARLFQEADLKVDINGDVQDILFWLGQGVEPNKPGAGRADNALYAGTHPAYRPRRGPLQRPEELLLVNGFASLEPAWVRRYFTVWGADGRINLNLADKLLLLAVAPELEVYWPAIQRHRLERGFQRMDELITTIRLPMDVYQRVIPHLALETDTLEISVEVRLPAWYEQHRIIVERPTILIDSPTGAPPRILARDIIESRPLASGQ